MSRVVLDACVAVAAVREHDPGHLNARARLARLIAGLDTMVVPSIFQVEVASALARARWSDDKISEYVDRLVYLAEIVTIGPKGATQIVDVAMRTRLRAADAAYVWLATRERVALVTSDAEVLACDECNCVRESP